MRGWDARRRRGAKGSAIGGGGTRSPGVLRPVYRAGSTEERSVPRRGAAPRTFAVLFSYNSARGLPLGNNNIPQAADIRLRKAEMQTVGLTVRRCAVLF